MGKTIRGEYQGKLRTTNVHLGNGASLTTDVTVDAEGTALAFSPTELVASALADCIMTIMGLKAEQKGWDLSGTRYEIEEVMVDGPRRIGQIIIDFYLPEEAVPVKGRKLLEACAGSCPVSQSLHPEMEQTVRFHWSD